MRRSQRTVLWPVPAARWWPEQQSLPSHPKSKSPFVSLLSTEPHARAFNISTAVYRSSIGIHFAGYTGPT